ncbi:MAG: hypothetical protein MUC77_09020 [Chromatiaceae bacterium]|nr:hypothetical protein [Chromatiaceae bacterium]
MIFGVQLGSFLQRRYKILGPKDTYLLELTPYAGLNPGDGDAVGGYLW